MVPAALEKSLARVHGQQATHSSRQEFRCLKRNFRRTFSIGGVRLALNGDSAADVQGGVELQQFQSADSEAEMEVNIRWTNELFRGHRKNTFESGATWRLTSTRDHFLFEFATPVLGSEPYKQLRINRTFDQAELTLSRTALHANLNVLPIEYPVGELLVTNYLAGRGLGVEVHGCGLIDQEAGGHLFLGHSGAGKSTTAKLWERLRHPKILSDDRIILRLHEDKLWMYGTPWHGEAAFALPRKSKLGRIFILQHGKENKFSRLSQSRAVAEIFARSFPPFHDSAGIERTIDFLKQALNAVPCYEFEFVPESSAISAVLAFHD